MKIRTSMTPLVIFQPKNHHKWLLGLTVLYILLASVFGLLVVKESFGLKSCQVEQLAIPEPKIINFDAEKSKRHLQLANTIQKVYNVPIDVSRTIVTAVAMNADKVFHEALILAVIATESSFRKGAESEKQAVGYMQLTLASGRKVSYETYTNIQEGTSLLKHYYEELGSVDSAIQAYLIGVTAFKQGKRAPEYLAKIKENLKLFV